MLELWRKHRWTLVGELTDVVVVVVVTVARCVTWCDDPEWRMLGRDDMADDGESREHGGERTSVSVRFAAGAECHTASPSRYFRCEMAMKRRAARRPRDGTSVRWRDGRMAAAPYAYGLRRRARAGRVECGEVRLQKKTSFPSQFTSDLTSAGNVLLGIRQAPCSRRHAHPEDDDIMSGGPAI